MSFILNFFRRFQPLLFAAAVTCLITCLILFELNIAPINSLERMSRDLRFLIRGEQRASGKVVDVLIDDISIKAIGRWPWPRFVLAETINRLHAGGAVAIVVDLLFTEPEKNRELGKIQDLIAAYTRFGLLTDDPNHQDFFDKLVESAESVDNDTLLAGAISNAKNTILSAVVEENISENQALSYHDVYAFNADNDQLMIPSYGGITGPVAAFDNASKGMGFTNVSPDPDGAVRLGLTAAGFKGGYFLSLPVRAALFHLQIHDKKIKAGENNTIQIGNLNIPVTRGGKYFINHYGGNGSIPHYSLVDVLSGEVVPEVFEGKTVFIGGGAVGLGDHWANPYSAHLLGVELQAIMTDNLITNRLLERPGWLKYFDAFIVFIIGFLLCKLLCRLHIGWCIPISVVLFIAVSALAQYMFVKRHLLTLWAYPAIEIFVISAGVFLIRYLTEGREKRFLKNAFSQYINPKVVQRILKHPEQLVLGGEERELTVLFSDIRKFTTISETLTPHQLVSFMNRYLTVMTDVLRDHNGTLDKYIGDAIMTIFGAPEYKDDHAVNACKTAIKMMESLYDIRGDWTGEGMPEVRIGIGINTGSMLVGNIGSATRFNYTVMGDHVNLASRLEGLTKLYGVAIICSEFTKDRAGSGFVFRELDLVRVKGKEKPVRIFELMRKDYFTDGEYAFNPVFEKGLACYRKQHWYEAAKYFKETLEIKSGDSPSNLFIERCEIMKKTSIPKDWDGVYAAVAK